MTNVTIGEGSRGRTRRAFLCVVGLLAIFSSLPTRADEPYARSRDYDLQHSKMALRFDLDQKKVLGDVTHSLSILKDGTTKLTFDSVGLSIQNVSVGKIAGDRKSASAAAKFETTSDKLVVVLPGAAK
jgi:aminopeptidase N